MTNADVIRQMTDDELYRFLEAIEVGDIDYALTFCNWCGEDIDCATCFKRWLFNDAHDYNGLLKDGGINSGYAEPKGEPQTDDFFRQPTEEEMKSVRDYIDSISVPTGVNVFDLMDEPQTELVNDSPILAKDLVDDEFNPYDEECMRCKHLKLKCEFVPSYCKYEPRDEPQFDKDINVRSKDEPQTCDTCKHKGEYAYCRLCGRFSENNYEPKDEQSGKE